MRRRHIFNSADAHDAWERESEARDGEREVRRQEEYGQSRQNMIPQALVPAQTPSQKKSQLPQTPNIPAPPVQLELNL